MSLLKGWRLDDRTQEPPPLGRDPRTGTTADSAVPHQPAALQTLRQAMRRARSDDAERTGIIADLRAARVGRLELLKEALQPLVAQIPPDADMFELALMPGANPRLFIDMIGFVEMGRDARLYRLVQDTRHGRTTLAESPAIDIMVDAVTEYVARRLLERDKALAADAPMTPWEAKTVASGSGDRGKVGNSVPLRERRRFGAIVVATFAFLIDLLGSIAFFTLLAALGWVFWNRLRGQVG